MKIIDYEIKGGYIMEADDIKSEKKRKPIYYGWPEYYDRWLKILFPANWVYNIWKVVDYLYNKRNPSV